MLIQAAQGAVATKKSFYRSKYNKLTFRLGSKNKAKVAIANKLARVVYKVLAGDKYKDLGYRRGDPREQQIKQHLAALNKLGVKMNYVNHEHIKGKKEWFVEDSGKILQ